MKRRGVDWRNAPVDLLPSQVGRSAPSNFSPEVRLVWAVLESAVQSVVHRSVVRGRRERREFVDACEWLMDDQRDWPFAFANICDLLGLETSAVRRALSVEELLLAETDGAGGAEKDLSRLTPARSFGIGDDRHVRGQGSTSRQCPSSFIAGAAAATPEMCSGAALFAATISFEDLDEIDLGART